MDYINILQLSDNFTKNLQLTKNVNNYVDIVEKFRDKGEIMRFIETFREGNHISDVYLCKTKQIALTKNGKEYGSLVLQDKTGTVDAKIWE